MNVCGAVYFTAHFVLSYVSGINLACLSVVHSDYDVGLNVLICWAYECCAFLNCESFIHLQFVFRCSCVAPTFKK